METLYGQYPKRIVCQCNAEEMNADVITISLNDRCPVCSQTRQICIPKRDIKVKDMRHVERYEKQVA